MKEISLPTSAWRKGDVAMLALFQGRLTQPGPGILAAEGTGLVWPAGFSAVEPDDGPVRVLDPDGNVVLEVGDRFSVGGGRGADDAFVMNDYPTRLDPA